MATPYDKVLNDGKKYLKERKDKKEKEMRKNVDGMVPKKKK